jgi:hypothetical protein
MLSGDTSWADPLTERPDGTYALFRSNSTIVEVLSDAVASRTIWYFLDDEMLIASTSQRAIVLLLASFRFNDKVIPWMLSTGTLGPGHSWDSRLKCIPADSSIVLDRSSWILRSDISNCEFIAVNRSDDEHRKLFEQSLHTTFASLDLDYSKWILPLSGGYDSRFILYMLKDHANLRTITWGLKSALGEQGRTHIARSLAGLLGVKHDYHETGVIRRTDKRCVRQVSCVRGRRSIKSQAIWMVSRYGRPCSKMASMESSEAMKDLAGNPSRPRWM